tara:strand:+ start:531 stop:962 length:432 start_codon:yes stop_codon:yes gene_type:complete
MKASGPAALRVLSVVMGAFILAMGLAKLSWFTDTGPLEDELRNWWGSAPLVSRRYIDYVALPGLPVFARLVPLAELASGAALLLGYRIRLAAVVSLFMVLNFHFAMGILFQLAYLTNGYGPPVLGGLVALALHDGRLPFSVSR